MNYKVGQRVRVVHAIETKLIGLEGVIVRFDDLPPKPESCWIVRLPVSFSAPGRLADDEWCFRPCDIAPLTDPKAEAFLESIKRLKPYEEPLVREIERATSPKVKL